MHALIRLHAVYIILSGLVLYAYPKECHATDWPAIPLSYHFNKAQLPTATIYKLHEDRYGFIWLVTEEGIRVFNGSTTNAVHLPGNDQEVVCTYQYGQQLFAATYSGDLYCIDMLQRKVEEVVLPAALQRHGSAFVAAARKGNQLFFSKRPGTTIKITLPETRYATWVSPGSGNLCQQLQQYPVPDSLLQGMQSSARIPPNLRITDNYVFSGNNIYSRRPTGYSLIFRGNDYNIPVNEPAGNCLRVQNDLWVGHLLAGGLRCYTGYFSQKGKSPSRLLLPDVEVTDLMQDRKGNIWVSTLHQGLFIFPKAYRDFRRFNPVLPLYNANVYYVRHTGKELVTGYSQLIADIFKNGKLQQRLMGDTRSTFNPVQFCHIIKGKTYLFGTVSSYQVTSSGRSIFTDGGYKDHYYYGDKIYMCANGGYRIITADMKKAFIKWPPIHAICVFPLQDDSLYAYGTAKGLYIGNKRMNEIGQERITKVRQYHNTILACSSNGLFLLRSGKYSRLSVENGLPDNQCLQLAYEGGRYYYLLTGKGIALIDTASLQPVATLESAQLGDDAIIHHFDMKQGTLWLATSKGVLLVPQDAILKPLTQSPQVYLYMDNDKGIPYTSGSCSIPYRQNNVVKMKAEVLQYYPDPYTMAYTIEEDGAPLTDTVPLNETSFSIANLAPGYYTIRVIVRQKNGSWNITSAYHLNIMPLWYQRKWVGISAAIMLYAMLFYGESLIRKQAGRKKEKKLKEEHTLLQLRAAAFFAQLKPHFMFNALAPIQSFILKDKKTEALQYLQKFSTLMRNVLNHSESLMVSLEEELHFLQNYVEIQQQRFSSSFRFQLVMVPDLAASEIMIPAMMLQPVIENAIEHGVKGRQEEGIITLSVHIITLQKERVLHIKIEDNGNGLPPHFLPEKGHALHILEKRISLLKKQYRYASFNICNKNGYTSGVVVELLFPLHYIKKKPV